MSLFIIPMAGLSSRFFKSGYTKPKYQLDILGQSMFSWSVSSFVKYFSSDTFIFICRNIYETPQFIKNEVKKLGISNYQVFCLKDETRGQAETVYSGLKQYLLQEKTEPEAIKQDIYIFNIDSKIVDFIKPAFTDGTCDGYLEVFEEEGEHWSFVLPGNDNKVLKTTEKKRISKYCSDGLYYFKSISSYIELFETNLKKKNFVNNEIYIAPMYNDLIAEGRDIRYELVRRDKVIICGTPKEYLSLLEKRI